MNEPPDIDPEARLCFWWRRGRVELPVQKSALQSLYKLIRLFVLAPLSSAVRFQWSQPMFLKRPLPTSGSQHLDIAAPNPQPIEERSRWA